MSKVEVRVLNAVVDGKGRGEILSIDEKSAVGLAKIGYVEIITQPKAEVKEETVEENVPKKESAPKPKRQPRTRKETKTE